MRSFLLNLGHLLALIFMTAVIMFCVHSLLARGKPMGERLGIAALQGLLMGSFFYYRAKPKA